MSNPPKIRVVCSHCRSESVTRDANASWNPDTQDWELEGVMAAAYCNDCGGECSLEEVPYRPRREITAAGFNGGTDATDDATLNSEELEEKYSPTGGGEHPLFKREDWRTAVNSDDTLLGYWGWVVNQLNQE